MTKTMYVLMLLYLAIPVGADAQERAQRFDNTRDTESAAVGQPFFDFARSRLSIAKWGTLLVSSAVGAYGFAANDDAEDRYAALEQLCAQDTVRCADRLPNSAFADASMEAHYQDVVRLDRRARVALIASQVGIATSVVLFILDLREGEAPPNIPYEPELSVRSDGTYEVRVRVY